MEDRFYTYNQIVEMFGICKQTLNNWRKKGSIRYRKINSRKFIYYLIDSSIY